MAAYVTRVRQDIDDWVKRGLIDARLADALRADVDANSSSRFSFAAVLSMMAAALFAAAILIFIAANWEVIPRLARVLMLFALILGGYTGGAMLKLRGHTAFGEAAWIVAATAFGASIALIGQMYHLSGDEKQAILVWCGGTAVAAAALRSGPLNVGSVLLASAWMGMYAGDRWMLHDLSVAYPALLVVLYILTFWTRSWASRNLVILSMFAYAFMLYWDHQTMTVPLALGVGSVAMFGIARFATDISKRYLGLGSELMVLGLLGFLIAVGLVQIDQVDEPGFVYPTVVAFLGIVGALLLGGAQSGRLRQLAYAAFIFQLGFVYVVMLGSMLDTAGFFVVGGLFLSLLAWFITTLEKRFSKQAEISGDAA